MSGDLPKKLKSDAILEAALEIRFEAAQSVLSEIFLGRFTDDPKWSGYYQGRLPTADIPAALRRTDPNLRYQPSLELTAPDGATSVRVGPEVVIFSRRGAYPGWTQFRSEIDLIVSRLYAHTDGAKVRRLGLRYINALKSDVHGINSVNDLDLKITVANKQLSTNLNLNYKTITGTEFETMARIASIDLADGPIPIHATVVIDIDVYTPLGYTAADAQAVNTWITSAHELEKKSFFTILGKENTDRLREA